MSVLSEKDDEEIVNSGVGRIDLWLCAVDLFCNLKNFSDATACLQEARNHSYTSADVIYWVF